MIRNEAINVATLRGEAQLYNVFGFMWTPEGATNTVTKFSAVTAEIEYESGAIRTLTVRPGAWYGVGQRMRRVWLWVGGGGVLAMATGDEQGDTVIPASPELTVTPEYERFLWEKAGPINWATDVQGNDNVDVTPPDGCKRMVIELLSLGAITSNVGGVINFWQQRIIGADKQVTRKLGDTLSPTAPQFWGGSAGAAANEGREIVIFNFCADGAPTGGVSKATEMGTNIAALVAMQPTPTRLTIQPPTTVQGPCVIPAGARVRLFARFGY